MLSTALIDQDHIFQIKQDDLVATRNQTVHMLNSKKARRVKDIKLENLNCMDSNNTVKMHVAVRLSVLLREQLLRNGSNAQCYGSQINLSKPLNMAIFSTYKDITLIMNAERHQNKLRKEEKMGEGTTHFLWLWVERNTKILDLRI